MTKEHLFSVAKKDCRFDYYRGSGKGGQKRNKTNSAVRCTHIDSGAVGQAEDTRSKHKNQEKAFRRMYDSVKFQKWLKLEIARHTGVLQQIEEKVDQMMEPKNLKIEYV